MIDINFYVKSMRSFIILNVYVIWEAYSNVTYCTSTRQSSGNWGRHAKQHVFLYQLWTTWALLNILFDPPNHDSQNSPDEAHEPKMRCCGMSSNYGTWWDYIAMSFGPWASASFLWIWTFLGFKIDSPIIHCNVDVVWVINEMRPRGVKNLSSTTVKTSVCWAATFSVDGTYILKIEFIVS